MTTTGIVTAAPALGKLMVQVAGALTARSIPCTRDVAATAAVGDQVLITTEGRQMWATGVLAAGAALTVVQDTYRPASPETTTVLTGTAGVTPVWAGTWDGSWRQDLPGVQCGANPDLGITAVRVGAVFWGGQLRAYGQLLAARMTVARTWLGDPAGAALPLRLLAGDGSRPGIYPAVLATVAGPTLAAGDTTIWQVPAAWLSRLGPGGDAGGIGLGSGSANPHLAIGRPHLTIDWKRGG